MYLGFFFWSFVGYWPIFLRNDWNIFGLFGHNDQKVFHYGKHNICRFEAQPANVKKQNQLLIVLFSKQVLLWTGLPQKLQNQIPGLF